MRTTTKFTLAAVVMAITGATVASQFIPVQEKTTSLGTQYTSNAGELTGEGLVGQTFVSQHDKLSGIAIMFATYSGRENTEKVIFHLRQHEAPSDIRTAQVDPRQLGDNQFYRFEFDPVADSAGKTYFFFVDSPSSRAGNAVTVDLNTQDPYHLGSAYFHGSGKPTVDVVFETYHTVPARAAGYNKAGAAARTFIGTWEEKKSTYGLWAKVGVPAVLFLVVAGLAYRRELTLPVWLPVLFAAALVFRLMYATELPLTNDEGNYLYDARTLREGHLAGGDGYVKAPLVIAWVAAWQFVFGDTILAGRLSSVAAGALTIFPLYMLARDLFSKKSGLIAAAAWAFSGTAAVFNIYVHTQPVALVFGTSGLAILIMALKGTGRQMDITAPHTRGKSGKMIWFFLAGVLLGLGVASRKSILALGLIPLVLVFLEALRHRQLEKWRLMIKQFVMIGLGFALVIGLFLGGASLVYGTEGFWEALGANSAEDGISAVTPEEEENVRAYSIRGMTPFFRESLGVLILALIGFGIAGERMVRSGIQRLLSVPRGSLKFMLDVWLPKIAWIPSLLLFLFAWKFFNEYEGSAFHILGIPVLWVLLFITLIIFAVLPRIKEDKIKFSEPEPIVPASTQDWKIRNQKSEIRSDFAQRLETWLVVPLWMIGLVIFYTNWIKFHANYLSEFIPPLILLAGPGTLYLFQRMRAPLFLATDYPPLEVLRKLAVLGLVVVIGWALFTSNYITFLYEHTGTFQLKALQQAAQFAQNVVPRHEVIFTGAAAVPYLSGHHVSLDIAHPRWYAYEFTRTDTQRLNTFLPPAEAMVQAFRDAKWVLLEQQTGFSFLMEYTEIERSLLDPPAGGGEFEEVKGIENGSNTLTFYRRVR